MDRTELTPSERNHDAVCGAAALSLLEALILTLRERNALTDVEIDDAFLAAIDAHVETPDAGAESFHRRVGDVLELLRTKGNSVRLRDH